VAAGDEVEGAMAAYVLEEPTPSAEWWAGMPAWTTAVDMLRGAGRVGWEGQIAGAAVQTVRCRKSITLRVEGWPQLRHGIRGRSAAGGSIILGTRELTCDGGGESTAHAVQGSSHAWTAGVRESRARRRAEDSRQQTAVRQTARQTTPGEGLQPLAPTILPRRSLQRAETPAGVVDWAHPGACWRLDSPVRRHTLHRFASTPGVHRVHRFQTREDAARRDAADGETVAGPPDLSASSQLCPSTLMRSARFSPTALGRPEWAPEPAMA
jgi:hypothetical protein